MIEEKDLDDFFSCNYCSNPLSKDKSESCWEGELHYIVSSCGCGKESWVKVDLEGFNPAGLFKKNINVECFKKKVSEE